MASLKDICGGLPVDPLPEPRQRDNSVPHAPVRATRLNEREELVSKFLKISSIFSVLAKKKSCQQATKM